MLTYDTLYDVIVVIQKKLSRSFIMALDYIIILFPSLEPVHHTTYRKSTNTDISIHILSFAESALQKHLPLPFMLFTVIFQLG